ncbi:MAG: hypothetical protein LQ340_004145 [Diploschistes diacapsis]|nr:MAG: hypothetical protein LQ340_004145 [Diploschistes diacapsis]
MSPSPAPLNPLPSDTSTEADPPRKPTILDGLKSVHPSDFAQVHKTPCARESLLTGMGAGFGVGGLRLVFGGNPWTSMTYAVFSFSLVSAGAHAICQRRRQLEQASMQRATEIMARKKEERAMKMAEMKAERERRREEHERQKSGWGRMTGWFGGGGGGGGAKSDENGEGRK